MVEDPEVEAELREAIRICVFRDFPGARRGPAHNQRRLEFRMHEETCEAIARCVRRVQALVPPPARILEVGSGTGAWATALSLAGYDVTGIDPNEPGVRAATLRALRYPQIQPRFTVARGERIPYPDDSFDLVVSNQVMEHVEGREAFARECHRVLKPGGIMLHHMPNYGFPWELHYRIPWPPRASRRVARAYLRLIRRDTRLFDEEIFPTMPKAIRRTFSDAGMVDLRDLYEEELAAKFQRGSFTRAWLAPGIRLLRAVGAASLFLKLVLRLELYPGIVLTGRKP